jgi:single-stranded-DNA-specific exonuclease
LRALADAARIDAAPNCYTLGFILGPRINAGGRTGASSLGARLLASDDEIEARSIAAKLETANAERRAIEESMLEDALARADALLAADAGLPLLFLAAEGWHKGLLGLTAGRIADRFRLPSFVASLEPDGYATGSARSIAGVDLGSVVRAAVHRGLLGKGGGHPMAAGFRYERRKQDALIGFLSEHLHEPVAASATIRKLPIDGAVSAGGANLALLDLLDRAGPYGPGHPEPRFVLPSHRLSRVRAIKEAHLRCTLQGPDGARIEACAFRIADTPLGKLLLKGEGLALHVAGHLRRSSWQGRESVELLIEDAADPRTSGP